MYPRIDILQISAILTDTDRIRIVISLFERLQIGYGYFATDILRICITPLFYFLNFILCILSTLDTGTNCKLSSYRVSSYQRIIKTNQS